MSRVCAIVLFVAFVFVCGQAGGNVVRPLDGLNSDAKDVKTSEPTIPAVPEPAQPSTEVEAVATTSVKECVPIGQFCNSHSDCCSNSCLGYMKRCVSGSG